MNEAQTESAKKNVVKHDRVRTGRFLKQSMMHRVCGGQATFNEKKVKFKSTYTQKYAKRSQARCILHEDVSTFDEHVCKT